MDLGLLNEHYYMCMRSAQVASLNHVRPTTAGTEHPKWNLWDQAVDLARSMRDNATRLSFRINSVTKAYGENTPSMTPSLKNTSYKTPFSMHPTCKIWKRKLRAWCVVVAHHNRFEHRTSSRREQEIATTMTSLPSIQKYGSSSCGNTYTSSRGNPLADSTSNRCI